MTAAYFIFGFITLAFQLVSVRWLGMCLGLDAAGVLLGHGLFMISMGIGAALCHGTPHKALPSSTVILASLVLGACSIASPWILPPAAARAAASAGWSGSYSDWWRSLPTLFAVLFPGAAACGALFPALEHSRTSSGSQEPQPHPPMAKNYAAWTAGCALAAFSSLVLLIRWIDFRQALVGLGLGSVALAGIFAANSGFLNPKDARKTPSSPGFNTPPPPEQLTTTPILHHLSGCCLGFIGGGFQMIMVRFLGENLEGTFFTYGIVTLTSLVFSAWGASIITRTTHLEWWERFSAHAWIAFGISAPLLVSPTAAGLEKIRAAWTPSALMGAETLASSLILGPASFFMGAWFACMATKARAVFPQTFGRWYGLNLAGAGLAGLSILGIVAPAFGLVRAAMFVIALALIFSAVVRPRWKWIAVASLGAFGVALLPENTWPARRAPQGEKLISQAEGLSGTVSVTEDQQQRRTLRVNKRFQMGGTSVALPQRRQADIPLLLHPHPRRALFLGAGTGITARRALSHPGLVADAIELLPEVLAVRALFDDSTGTPATGATLQFWAGDARRWVAKTTNRYDVIVGDLFHPGLDGVAGLYTLDHFQRVRATLAPGGLYCQWLPVYQMDESMLQLITRTFLDAFPDAQAWILHFNIDLPVLALIGGAPYQYEGSMWNRRAADPQWAQVLRATGFSSPYHHSGCYVASATTLRSWSGNGPRNTDLRPLVAVLAPKVRFREESDPGRVLTGLLKAWSSAETYHPDPEWRRFVDARNSYLEGLSIEAARDLGGAMDAYLRAASQSLYFTPAYARCVETIRVTASVDRARAKEWFQRLESVRPDQPLARRLLGSLFDP